MKRSIQLDAIGVKDLRILWEDGERVLCRGRRVVEGGGGVTVLVVIGGSEQSTPSEVPLKHELELREDLDPAWAVRPLELSREAGWTVLLLEDPGGEPLARHVGAPMDMASFLPLAIGVAAALGKAHHRGLVHKDVKPANILMNCADGGVRLTGFSVASMVPRQRQPPEPPEIISGTLAYMAPEQTGRVNRSIDSRSDLYALGVTFYEMLTGKLPFHADEAMEWVHCHIARKPVPPAERLGSIPAQVSDIVLKLLSKAPEDRYQTAAGVGYDLRCCLNQWEVSGHVTPFALCDRDISDRLMVSERLYGREGEVKALLGAFHRVVTNGGPELVLVSGYSGIGKTSVVNELHKALVPPRGLFASGKFEQLKRDIPYSTLVQAFQSLVRALLSRSDEELSPWRKALVKALGQNAKLIVDLIPELAIIIGRPPPVPELDPQQAQSRFHFAVRRFIEVVARPEHPLALFLDDLQWVDSATLDLIEDMLARPELRHLMLVGAYRDNEVDATHPLMRKLKTIKSLGGSVTELNLEPLAKNHVRQLIADALRTSPERIVQLSDLVHEKTAGNPFFVLHYLRGLSDEGLLAVDHQAQCWSWDLERIHAKGYADNVVDLMVAKLARLPNKAQRALQQLACLGIMADFTTLAIVLAISEDDVHLALWPAVRLELVERLPGSYRFVHDRVQEAAYSLIPEGRRAAAHLMIGRLLVVRTPLERHEEAVFEIVNQLNRGAALISLGGEREQLAQLNLIAGKRAKRATAYAAALQYFSAGRKALGDKGWDLNSRLAFDLELNWAECEYLTGFLAQAQERLSALSALSTNLVEAAAVACLRMTLYTTLDRSDQAVDVALEYFRNIGMHLPLRPTDGDVEREYDQLWRRLGDRAIEALLDLPVTRDPEHVATFNVLTLAVPAANFTDENLFCVIVARMAKLSLEHGNSDASSHAYVWLGMIQRSRFRNFDAGFRFGRLGIDLVELRGLDRFKARIYSDFGHLINPWARHLRDGVEWVRRAVTTAQANGDLTFGSFAGNSLTMLLLASGEPLGDVQREIEVGLEFTRKVGFGLFADIMTGQLGLVRALRGLTADVSNFGEEHFDERRFQERLETEPRLAFARCWYWVRKLQANFHANDYAAAAAAADQAQSLMWKFSPFFEVTEYHFYGALARAAACGSSSASEQPRSADLLLTHHRQLETLAQYCPENFESRAALVAAEIARIEGRETDAMRLYEQTIRSARVNGFLHIEALAQELAAHFYQARGFEQIGHMYLRNARNSYLRWGADGKVRQLEDANPQIMSEESVPGPTSTVFTPVERLDLATVIKVSQAVSAEIVPEKLLDTLMRTAIEQAGAERGLLILSSANEQRIAVEAITRGDAILVKQSGEAVNSAMMPESVFRFVLRTHESVVLDDAAFQNPFSADTYLRERQPRSILCMPLINQAKLIGVLYLENKLSPHVFSPSRAVVLKLLASQAAISLENSRLYRDLEEREAKIRRLVDANIVGIFIWDFDGSILEANDAFLRIVGYDREDIAMGALRWTDLTPPDWRERDEQWVREHKASGVRAPIEKEYFRKDGKRVPILIAAATFDQSETQGVGFVLDLTERKQAEEAIRQREAAIRGLADSNIIGIFVWEFPNTRIVEANDAFLRIVGYEREDLVAGRMNEMDFTPSEWKAQASQTIAELQKGRITPPPYEKEYFRKDGSRVPVIGVGTLVEASDGGARRGVSYVVDLSERKQAEEALREMQFQLAHANRVATMGQLTASIAHEVNQPLGATVTNAQAALRWLDGPEPDLEEARLALGRIVRDGNRGGAVVGRIRDLIKKTQPHKDPVEINSAIREVIEVTRNEALKNGVSVQTELADDLPVIYGDRIELQQVLLNLIINAVEAMRDMSEGPRNVLIVTDKTEGKEVLVSVRDSGPGLSPAIRDNLFQAFQTTKPNGLGLGLSICRSIIEAHSGRLWTSANAARGTVFQFALPHADAEHAQ